MGAYADRVQETTVTTGTGTLTLAGAVTAHITFAASVTAGGTNNLTDGGTTRICITEVDANGNPSGAWEVCTSVFTVATNTVSRGALQSSSTGSRISFAAGTKRVFVVMSADEAGDFATLSGAETFSTGVKTFNDGKLSIKGAISGNVKIQAPAVAGVDTIIYINRAIVSGIVPMILQSSGTMGANGALSAITAMQQYASCYMFFPAGRVFSGSAAGLYYTTMLTTTTATVWNNAYTGGTPTIPASPTAVVDAGPGAYTQTLAAITVITNTVPGGSLGKSGNSVQKPIYSVPNNANAKTASIFFANSSAAQSLASTRSSRTQFDFRNSQSESVNVAYAALATPFGSTVNAPLYTTINTAVDQTASITFALGVATDYMVLEAYILDVTYGA